jgi:hypothetical protein
MENRVNTPLLITIIAISVGLLVVIGLGVQSWFNMESTHETARQWDDSPNVWLTDLRKTQQDHLAAGKIDEAMKAIVANNGKLPATQP